MLNHIELFDKSILTEKTEDSRYENSIFRTLKTLGPKIKGSVYEKIVRSVFSKLGHTVEKAKSTDYDAIIDGKRVEIKGSMLNKGTDYFSFLQIRPNQKYDSILFAFFYPDSLIMVSLPKEKINDAIALKIFKPQHGGKNGNSHTFCYYGTETKLIEIGGTFV